MRICIAAVHCNVLLCALCPQVLGSMLRKELYAFLSTVCLHLACVMHPLL